MILVTSGQRDERGFDACLQFAWLLKARGHAVIVDAASAPESLNRSQKYEAAPFLAEPGDAALSRVLVIGAEDIGEATLAALRDLRLPAQCRVTALGCFADVQARISAVSRLAYVLGREPAVVDLLALQPKPIRDRQLAPLFVPSGAGVRPAGQPLRLFLVVPPEALEDADALPVIEALANRPEVDLCVVTAGKGKGMIRASRYSDLRVLGISEFPAPVMAQMADAAAIFGANMPGERIAAMALQLMRAGGVVIDCTDKGAIAATGAPVLRGPRGLAGLGPFLATNVAPNRAALAGEMAADGWLQACAIERLEKALALPPAAPAPRRAPDRDAPRTLFMPTNGVGLGHAQRCLQIAAELPDGAQVGFAAFPSCLPMLRARGHACLPLVSRSDLHADDYANDIVNYLRLSQVVRPGDRLVFDGGYVFDSLYRTVAEKRARGIWIRRGLWQAGQLERTPIEREAVFDRVIVPLEAFDELNTDYSRGRHVHRVGPVVQQGPPAMARDALRTGLAERFDRGFERLVVTMLGGGEAADRSAQIQTLCAQLAGRDDCLHLVVVWPGAKVAPGLFGWENTRVVRTRNALSLARASDLLVSAAGYNSFHEVLYHRIPAIFIPQMASYMDDQERRARAASDRGCAVTVLAHELLLLQREVTAFLDGSRATELANALLALDLPRPGNRAAAAIIAGEDGHGG